MEWSKEIQGSGNQCQPDDTAELYSFRCACGHWISCLVEVGWGSRATGEAKVTCGNCSRCHTIVAGFPD